MFHCSLTSPPTGRSLQINKPQQSTSINKWVRGLELPGMRGGEGGGVQQGPSLPLSQCKSLKCSLQAGNTLQKYRGQCLTHGKRGRKCSWALVTSSPVHNSQNKQLSSSANYRGRKSALASSVWIQPNKICVSLSRWDYSFFLIYTYSMQLTHWNLFQVST